MAKLTTVKVKSVRAKLKAVLEKNGITGYDIDLGNARFGESEITFQLKVKVAGAKSKEESALEMYAKIDGVDITTVSARGEMLVEYHPRKRQYPYISKNQTTGKMYKMSKEQAIAQFGSTSTKATPKKKVAELV